MFWTLEQPFSSLMWLFKPMLDCMTRHCVAYVYVDVCWFGAPWKKPTSIATNFAPLSSLSRTCCCISAHLSLQGNAPDGRSWTAVASPYWPSFAKTWAKCCISIKPCGELMPIPSHLAGFASAPANLRLDQVLDSMKFVQPKGRENRTTAVRVSSGV